MKITICGSMAFVDEMQKVKADLEARGLEVCAPVREAQGNFAGTAGGSVVSKSEAIRRHFDKVAWADAILVLNQEKHNLPSYIGPNTLMEMGLAFYFKKPIYLMFDIPIGQFTEEITGMNPTTLRGDLSLLSTQ